MWGGEAEGGGGGHLVEGEPMEAREEDGAARQGGEEVGMQEGAECGEGGCYGFVPAFVALWCVLELVDREGSRGIGEEVPVRRAHRPAILLLRVRCARSRLGGRERAL